MKRSYISLGSMLLAVLLFTQCETPKYGCTDPNASNYDVAADENDGSCIYGVDINGYCEANSIGNLTVTNQTDEVLLLYNNFDYVQCIPAGAENFLIYVTNKAEGIDKCVLQIWKADNVEDKSNPDISSVYRQWTVALSATTQETEHTSWVITDNDEYFGSGTLHISYPDIDDYGQANIYQVDVYLNSQDGALISSLQAGTSGKKVSIDYGVHYLYFNYWFSDPDSQSGEVSSIGWSESSAIIINVEHNEREIDIPVYYSNFGKYGELKVVNETSKPITVYADGMMIETIAKVEGSSEGLSMIPENSSTTFLVPVATYGITAKTIDGATTVETFKTVDVLQNEKAVKYIGVTHQEVNITNNTSEILRLYSTDLQYLGAAFEPGETANLLVPASFDSLVVFNADQSKSQTIAANATAVNSLEDYQTTSFSITTPWNEIVNGHYQSVAISNDESTEMTATLTNYENVEFSFDYKVSTELNYDEFSFTINGEHHLDKLSGEIEWTNFGITLEPGTHTIQWIYTKDQMYDSGDDQVEIKNISVN